MADLRKSARVFDHDAEGGQYLFILTVILHVLDGVWVGGPIPYPTCASRVPYWTPPRPNTSHYPLRPELNEADLRAGIGSREAGTASLGTRTDTLNLPHELS